MPDPFLVMATQNPIENEGVYPLPEAQRDRFLFKILVGLPGGGRGARDRLPDGRRAAGAQPGAVDPDELVRLQGVASQVFVHHALVDYVVRLVVATRTPAEHGMPDVAGWVVLRRVPARHRSASSRAARALALVRGRDYVLPAGRAGHRAGRAAAPAGALLRRAGRRRAGRPHRRPGAADGPAAAGHRPSAGGPAPAATPPPDMTVIIRPRDVRSGRSRRRAAPAGRRSGAGGASQDAGGRRPGSPIPARRPRSPRRRCATGRSTALQSLELIARGGSTGCCRATTSACCPGRAASRGRPRSTSPATTCAGWTGRSPPAPPLPHVRQTVADRELETWLVVDLSASLDFGTAACDKRDLAVAGRGGGHAPDRAAAATGSARVVGTGERTVADPGPRRHRARSQGLLRTVAPTPRRPGGRRGDLAAADRGAAPAAAPPRAGRGGLRLPRRARAGSGRCGRVGAGTTCSPIEVVDPRELELPDVGTVVLADPETGRQHEVLTTTADCARAFAAARAAHRDRGGGGAAPAPGPRTCGCAPTPTGCRRRAVRRSRASGDAAGTPGDDADDPGHPRQPWWLLLLARRRSRSPSATSWLQRRRRRAHRALHQRGPARARSPRTGRAGAGTCRPSR